MMFAALWCLRLVIRTPGWLLNKVNQIIRRSVVFGFRLSGLLCLIGIGLGFSSVSWLVCQLLYTAKDRERCSVDSKPSTGSSRGSISGSSRGSTSGSSRGSICETNGTLSAKLQDIDMGNSHSSDKSIKFSDLRHRYSYSSDSSSPVGAQIHEHNTGHTLTSEINACCSGAAESNLIPHSSSNSPAEPVAPGVGGADNFVCSVDDLDNMKDSGFQEPVKQTLVSTEDSLDLSAVVFESEEKDLSLDSSGAHGVNKNNSGITDDKNKCTSTLESEQTLFTSAWESERTLCTSALESKENLPLNGKCGADSLRSNGDTLLVRVGEGSLSALDRLSQSTVDSSIVRLTGQEDGDELDDLFFVSTPRPTSAELRRKSFSEKKDRNSLPSPVLSERRMSRTASLRSEYSIDVEVGIEIPANVSFTTIESGIATVVRELTEQLTTLNRLSCMQTYEFYPSATTTHRLSNLVGSLDETISKEQVDKGFDVLRKCRTDVVSPRMSSVPPTPEGYKTSDFYAESRLVESKSFHELPRYVVHEDFDCNVTIDSDSNGDRLSLDSCSTLETQVGSEQYDSIPSMDSVISANSCTKEEGCDTDHIIVDIVGYVEREWKGNTSKAELIRKGYRCVMNDHHYQHIARIRGDNYCALRSTYCSLILNHIKPDLVLKQVLPRLSAMNDSNPHLLQSWVFPDCMSDVSGDDDEAYNQLCECLIYLISQTRSLQLVTDPVERRKELYKILNTGELNELYILEGMKLLMLLSAYELHKAYLAEQEVPVFVWLLFARDTSENPALFLKNHVNRVGKDAGLEQVEMCLLGYSLGVALQTFRLYQYGEVDFVAIFPEENEHRDHVPIIVEDDRHYNTLIQPDALQQCMH